MGDAVRYQLLDHATDEAPLWDCGFPITEHTAAGTRERHRSRSPEELQPELERLLREEHVQLYEMTDPEHRLLTLTEALNVMADGVNWHSPLALGYSEPREVIYALVLTDSGEQEFQREYSEANG
jgi:hypothetical protein